MKKRFRKQLMSALFAVGMAPMATMATLLTYDLDFEFSGATAPAGTPSWISATFDDDFGGGANTVRLTMSATNLVDVEFIDDWVFNFDPGLDPTDLSFAWVSGQMVSSNGVTTGINFLQADGDGKFDINFDYAPPGGSSLRFIGGETSVYDITYVSLIDVTYFDYQSVEGGGNGTYGSAAHIGGIAPDGEASGWIGPDGGDPIAGVPEPSILALFSIGLLSMAASAWRRRKI